jgi:hypothetical protein
MAFRKGVRQQNRPPLVECLETRTLLSAAQHAGAHGFFFSADFKAREAPAVIRPADETVSATSSGEGSGKAQAPAIVLAKSVNAGAPSGGSGVAANGEEKGPWVSSGVVWGRWGGPQANVAFSEFNITSDDAGDGSGADARSSGTMVVTLRPEFRRTDQDLPAPPGPAIPPSPPAAAAASSGTSPAAAATSPVAPKFAAALEQADAATSARTDASRDPAGGAVVAGSASATQIATGPLKKTLVDLAEFFMGDGLANIGQGYAAARVIQGAGIFSSAAQSVDFVEKLLMSDAAVWAHVADGTAVQLYEVDALLWKGAAGIAGAAMMIVAAGMNRDRVESRLPQRQRKLKYLCVGEKTPTGMDY